MCKEDKKVETRGGGHTRTEAHGREHTDGRKEVGGEKGRECGLPVWLSYLLVSRLALVQSAALSCVRHELFDCPDRPSAPEHHR